MPPQQHRPSDTWNAVADESLDLADVAAGSAEHFAREGAAAHARARAHERGTHERAREDEAQRTADTAAAGHRMVEAACRMHARRLRERARLIRAHEDARAREDAIDQEATTGRYVVRWTPERWWHRLARVFRPR